jgi:hypothetical protein
VYGEREIVVVKNITDKVPNGVISMLEAFCKQRKVVVP